MFGLRWSLDDVRVAEVASADETETRSHEEEQMDWLGPFVFELVFEGIEASHEIDRRKSYKIEQKAGDGIL